MHTSLGMKPCQCGQQPRLVASAEPLRFYTCHHLSCWETRGLDHPKGRDRNAHNSHSQQPIVARVEPADAEQAVLFRVSLCVREALQLVFSSVRGSSASLNRACIEGWASLGWQQLLASTLEVGKVFSCQMLLLINSCLWHQLWEMWWWDSR